MTARSPLGASDAAHLSILARKPIGQLRASGLDIFSPDVGDLEQEVATLSDILGMPVKPTDAFPSLPGAPMHIDYFDFALSNFNHRWIVNDTGWEPWGRLSSESERLDFSITAALVCAGAGVVLEADDRVGLVWSSEHTDPSIVDGMITAAELADKPTSVILFVDGWVHSNCIPPCKLKALRSELAALPSAAIYPPDTILERQTPTWLIDEVNRSNERRGAEPRPFTQIEDQVLIFNQEGGTLRYESVGRDARIVSLLGERWRQTVVGSPFDAGWPDPRVDQIINDGYRQALHEGKILSQDLSTVMKIDGQRIHVTYTRTLFPVATGRGIPKLGSYVATSSRQAPWGFLDLAGL